MAAGVPSQLQQAVTSVDSVTGEVLVSWTKPAENGSAITNYIVEFDSGSDW